MSLHQQGLESFGGGVDDERPHLTKERAKGCSSKYSVDQPNEYWCTRCGHRITVSGQMEYGHARGRKGDMELCPHHCRDGDLR